jgi:hypothetical protein
VLVAAVVYVPWAPEAFATRHLHPVEASVCVALALAPFAAIELAKLFYRRRRRSRLAGDPLVVGWQW